jgi:hypothetical protein
VVSVLLAQQGEPGLRYLDRDARTVACEWKSLALLDPLEILQT